MTMASSISGALLVHHALICQRDGSFSFRGVLGGISGICGGMLISPLPLQVGIAPEGMVGSRLFYVGMSWCVRKWVPVLAAAFSPLVQIMAIATDIPILQEQLHLGMSTLKS